jgi:hypothetical protein
MITTHNMKKIAGKALLWGSLALAASRSTSACYLDGGYVTGVGVAPIHV